LNEIDIRKAFVDSFARGSEELRLHNLVYNLTFSNPSLKALSSNASPHSPGLTVRFWEAMLKAF
jgi:hypothetical protein